MSIGYYIRREGRVIVLFERLILWRCEVGRKDNKSWFGMLVCVFLLIWFCKVEKYRG